MTQARRSIVIDVEPKVLYDIIVDFEKYPEFQSDLTNVKIDAHNGNEWTVTFTLHIIKKFDYVLHLKGKPYESVTWSLAKKGFMKKNDGGWELKDLGNGQTEATYFLEVDLGLLAPKGIVNMLLSTNFPKMLQSFKERAENMD